MASGFLEYRLPNILPKYKKCKKLSISMELCSEAPGYDETWESRIDLSINGLSCGCYHSLGDYGSRRGIYTPEFWQNGLTQYGKLVTWAIDKEGVSVNLAKVADMPIEALKLEESSHILMRLEAKDQGKDAGGLNLFGEGAGDYRQPIILSVEH
jgi:predicted transcriptional regulator